MGILPVFEDDLPLSELMAAERDAPLSEIHSMIQELDIPACERMSAEDYVRIDEW